MKWESETSGVVSIKMLSECETCCFRRRRCRLSARWRIRCSRRDPDAGWVLRAHCAAYADAAPLEEPDVFPSRRWSVPAAAWPLSLSTWFASCSKRVQPVATAQRYWQRCCCHRSAESEATSTVIWQRRLCLRCHRAPSPRIRSRALERLEKTVYLRCATKSQRHTPFRLRSFIYFGLKWSINTNVCRSSHLKQVLELHTISSSAQCRMLHFELKIMLLLTQNQNFNSTKCGFTTA